MDKLVCTQRDLELFPTLVHHSAKGTQKTLDNLGFHEGLCEGSVTAAQGHIIFLSSEMGGSSNLDLMAQSFIQDGNSYIAAPQSRCTFNTQNPLVTATLDMPNMAGRNHVGTLHYLLTVKLNNACLILYDSFLKTVRTLKVLQNIWQAD